MVIGFPQSLMLDVSQLAVLCSVVVGFSELAYSCEYWQQKAIYWPYNGQRPPPPTPTMATKADKQCWPPPEFTTSQPDRTDQKNRPAAIEESLSLPNGWSHASLTCLLCACSLLVSSKLCLVELIKVQDGPSPRLDLLNNLIPTRSVLVSALSGAGFRSAL